MISSVLQQIQMPGSVIFNHYCRHGNRGSLWGWPMTKTRVKNITNIVSKEMRYDLAQLGISSAKWCGHGSHL